MGKGFSVKEKIGLIKQYGFRVFPIGRLGLSFRRSTESYRMADLRATSVCGNGGDRKYAHEQRKPYIGHEQSLADYHYHRCCLAQRLYSENTLREGVQCLHLLIISRRNPQSGAELSAHSSLQEAERNSENRASPPRVKFNENEHPGSCSPFVWKQ